MALVLADRVRETTNTTGTGTLTLAGAVSGYRSFAVVGNANTTYYTIVSGTAWEVGIGTYTSVGTTLSRDTVYASSAAGAKITVAAGADVFVTYPAGQSVVSGSSVVFSTVTANASTAASANAGAINYGTLSYSDTDIVASFATTSTSYAQMVLQNKSNGVAASTNFNVSNDAGTATTNYGEFGINSSTFTGTGSLSAAGTTYLASASTDLAIGTYGANAIHFVVNSGATDAATISSAGLLTANNFASSSAAITGGSINGTTVGATTASTGAFTSLTATSTVDTGVLAASAGQTANVTIANTVTYTTGGKTLASQTAAANSTWRVRAFGTFTAANSATARNAQVACFWGTTQLTAITSTVLTATAQTTQFQLEFDLTASSTTAVWTTGTLLNRTNSATALAINNATPASTTVTAGAQTLDLRFSMSVSVAGDSWSIQSVTMERLK